MTSIITGINLYSTGSTTKLKIESIESEVETEGVQTTSDDTDVSSKYDTLELSQDYVNYKMQGENTTTSDESSLLNSQTGEEMAPPPPPPPMPPEAAAESSEESSEDSSGTDLSSYSDSELKELVEAGVISRAQYMAELASREDEDSSDTSTSTDTSSSVSEV